MPLDERKLRILSAIVNDYVQTAVPVGSRTITRHHDIGVSPATIRNEMSDLTELGYLDQPHVSAGRVPSSKAYRLYVDMLLEDGAARLRPDPEARRYFDQKALQMEDVVKTAVRAVSELTHLTAIAILPGQPDMRISTLQLVPMPRGSALLVIVTDSGIVRDTVLHVNSLLDMDALYSISRALTERLRGRTLKDVQQMLEAYARRGSAEQQVVLGVRDLAAQMARQAAQDTVDVEGIHNILNYPEFSDPDRARTFMTALEQHDSLTEMMRGGDQELTVRIGPELSPLDMTGLSAVSGSFVFGSCRGRLGVVGPMRMPYEQVIRVVATVSRSVTEIFAAERI